MFSPLLRCRILLVGRNPCGVAANLGGVSADNSTALASETDGGTRAERGLVSLSRHLGSYFEDYGVRELWGIVDYFYIKSLHARRAHLASFSDGSHLVLSDDFRPPSPPFGCRNRFDNLTFPC